MSSNGDVSPSPQQHHKRRPAVSRKKKRRKSTTSTTMMTTTMSKEGPYFNKGSDYLLAAQALHGFQSSTRLGPTPGRGPGGDRARAIADEADERVDDLYANGVCGLSQLSYRPLPYQNDIQNTTYETRLPANQMPVEGETILDWYLDPIPNTGVSLCESYFSFTFKVLHEDGSPLKEDEPVSCSVFPLNTLFKTVRFFISNEQVTSATSTNHPYEAYLAACIHMTPETKRTQSQLGLLLPDLELNSRDYTFIAQAAPDFHNIMKRRTMISLSRPCTLVGRILHEFFLVPSLLPGSLDMRISLHLDSANRFLIADPTNKLKVRLTECKFFLCRYHLTPSALTRQLRLLSTRGLTFNFTRWETRVVTMAAGLSVLHTEIFRGRCPDRIVFFMVPQDAYNGSLAKNAYHLSSHDLKFFQMYMNDIPRPSTPYQLFTDADGVVNATEAYYLLIRELNLASHLNMTPYEFLNGGFYLSVDLSADHSSGSRQTYMSPMSDGVLVAKAEFAKPLPAPLCLVFSAHYPASLELHCDKTFKIVI